MTPAHIAAPPTHTGPNTTTRPSYSEAVKRLKLRCLQMLLLQAPSCRAMVFCRTQLDCALVHQFLHSLGGEGDGAACASVVLSAQGHRQDRTAALEVSFGLFGCSSLRGRVCVCVFIRAFGVRGSEFVWVSGLSKPVSSCAGVSGCEGEWMETMSGRKAVEGC